MLQFLFNYPHLKGWLLAGIGSVFMVLMRFDVSNAQGVDNVLTVPSSYLSGTLKGNGNFNALIFGDITSNSGDTEGRLAVGGNFAYTNASSGYSVGIVGAEVGSVNPPANTDNFIVNGQYSNLGNAWQVRGNIVFNQVAEGSMLPSTEGLSQTGVAEHIKFNGDDLLKEYQTLSARLAGFVANGSVNQEFHYDPIQLVGTDASLNVFDVTIPTGHNSGIEITVPAGSSVLVNVSNTAVSISDGNMTINGVGIPSYGAGEKVLFNFPNATELSLTRFGMLASVLSPKANLTASGGSINGQSIIGGNVVQGGSFEFHNFNLTANFDSALPVTLNSFDVSNQESQVVLDWKTSEETNSSHFEVQHSTNAKEWRTLAFVDAQGHSTSESRYHLVDDHAMPGANFYRLKMIDMDGTYSFSRIRSIDVERVVRVYPNPVADKLYIESDVSYDHLVMYDRQGKEVLKRSYLGTSGMEIGQLSEGIYVISLIKEDGLSVNHKVLVRR
ncbi:putative secreted protein (Por secretion system target)/choice-of-anchor A domain-containing protein [Dyadobacter jejuensis]|uniref:Putative secreted protein (Por secretion system target)/choice-of-anchor A domain-containing protein n=1 Tax=Dyadobacter jejuensis TaxID=1082580 RepID=A0A316ACV0_9BACT|nr:collagen-binding domain-containing protein [Dyadobacter jejuensis]PWJ55585.1 putative secreted protein (Por secretion system target)/choice-of-anchor A domain-containing protein [Dyadobacter jejuensis]